MTRKLSSWETMERRRAADFANASLRLEGLEPSPEALRRAEQFVAGEIEAHQLVASGVRKDASPPPAPQQQDDGAATGGGTSLPIAGRVPGRDLEQERAERQKMVDRVNASGALEGYTPDVHLADLQRRFVALEIGTAEMLESCREFALKMGAQQGDAQ